MIASRPASDPSMRALAWLAGLLLLGGCTPRDDGIADGLAARLEASRPLNVGLLYWALPRPAAEGENAILIVEGELVAKEVRGGEGLARRGTLVHEGIVRITRVLRDQPPRPRGTGEVQRYAGQRFLRTDGLEGVEVGDRLVVYIHDYDGGYGIVPASDLGGRNVELVPDEGDEPAEPRKPSEPR